MFACLMKYLNNNNKLNELHNFYHVVIVCTYLLKSLNLKLHCAGLWSIAHILHYTRTVLVYGENFGYKFLSYCAKLYKENLVSLSPIFIRVFKWKKAIKHNIVLKFVAFLNSILIDFFGN